VSPHLAQNDLIEQKIKQPNRTEPRQGKKVKEAGAHDMTDRGQQNNSTAQHSTERKPREINHHLQ
jgi:hypothetical protein